MTSAGPLGDHPQRDYARKLRQFNAFAGPDLHSLMTAAGLRPGMAVLDAGCGTGETLGRLANIVGPDGMAVGVDLSAPHIAATASQRTPRGLVQADLTRLPLHAGSFDFIWCANTINHLRDAVDALRGMSALLRPGGRIALGQSSFLPDMYFAWDLRLERLVNEAVRQYYRDRYGLDERDLTAVRALVGLMREAGLGNVQPRTIAIERVSPVDAATEAYLQEAIFRQTWGERLRPYLADEDYAQLERLCDPRHPAYALRRPDFHFIHTFTLVTGSP
ncbi:class I SAM-dependent methyltransferase [Dyella sp. EPa41]|uniref:class I SAM-dependent methyltransferase n=1 Tax=Dyella sp. EPa41 TaxID=1561194 RepID=UPI001915F5B4|nr:class I SAM-dependent methyltransferase [Dyella sp. EPa41]